MQTWRSLLGFSLLLNPLGTPRGTLPAIVKESIRSYDLGDDVD
jgi:hypothetical protein